MLDLFTGMDGLGYALRALNVHPPPGGGLHIERFETDLRCRRLLELRMTSPHCHLSDETDSALEAGSVFWLVEDECRGTRALLRRYPNLRRVLVVGGSPCVGFSRANTTSRGIDDPESCKLWIFPVLLNYLFLHTPSIFFILENVQMAPAQEDAISSTLGCQPVRLDAASFGPCSRPRLFWTNLPLPHLPTLTAQPSSILDPGWRPLWELCPIPGVAPPTSFATFTRPQPPGRPPEFPAPFWKLSLFCYSERSLVYNTRASPADLEQVRSFLDSAIRVHTTGLRDRASPALRARGALATWIHQQGGHRALRPLLHHERDKALGFPHDASALPDDVATHDGFVWDRLQASGNSFAVPVLMFLLKPFADHLLHETPLTPGPGRPLCSTRQEAIQALTPTYTHPNARR